MSDGAQCCCSTAHAVAAPVASIFHRIFSTQKVTAHMNHNSEAIDDANLTDDEISDMVQDGWIGPNIGRRIVALQSALNQEREARGKTASYVDSLERQLKALHDVEAMRRAALSKEICRREQVERDLLIVKHGRIPPPPPPYSGDTEVHHDGFVMNQDCNCDRCARERGKQKL